MSKAVEECWKSYKEMLKESGIRKVYPRLRKKDIARMSFHDVLELVYDKFTGKNAVFDKPFGEISDDEWDQMNELMGKRFEEIFGRDTKEDTPPIYGEEQN